MAVEKASCVNELIADMIQARKVKWYRRILARILSGRSRNSSVWAYECQGQYVFPYYGTSNGLTASFVVILLKGKPLILDGGDFGMDEELKSDAGGFWKVLKFDTYSSPLFVIKKISSAFHEIEAA